MCIEWGGCLFHVCVHVYCVRRLCVCVWVCMCVSVYMCTAWRGGVIRWSGAGRPACMVPTSARCSALYTWLTYCRPGGTQPLATYTHTQCLADSLKQCQRWLTDKTVVQSQQRYDDAWSTGHTQRYAAYMTLKSRNLLPDRLSSPSEFGRENWERKNIQHSDINIRGIYSRHHNNGFLIIIIAMNHNLVPSNSQKCWQLFIW